MTGRAEMTESNKDGDDNVSIELDPFVTIVPGNYKMRNTPSSKRQQSFFPYLSNLNCDNSSKITFYF